MRIIAKGTLKRFWEMAGHRDAEQPLRAWYAEAVKSNWKGPAEIKANYGTASILKSNRVVFNIAGNKYRLVIAFRYDLRIGFVRFVGTHKEYDRIDAEEV